jgi:hypothetical protein
VAAQFEGGGLAQQGVRLPDGDLALAGRYGAATAGAVIGFAGRRGRRDEDFEPAGAERAPRAAAAGPGQVKWARLAA